MCAHGRALPPLSVLVALAAFLLPLPLPLPLGAAPAHAANADCNIWWNEVLHDSFDPAYRSPGGPVTPGTTVRLRLRLAQGDVTAVRLRSWNDRTNTETYLPLAWDAAFDTSPVYDWWFVDLAVGAQPTVLYYFFELNDAPGWCAADRDFYTDDDPKFAGGGAGTMRDAYDDQRSYQLTVYDAAFTTPEWMQRGVTYQVFPDRFRDGDAGNDPPAGRFFYGAGTTIARSGPALNPQQAWNTAICDPRGLQAGACPGHWGDNFYGGDLAGLADKVEDGYFDMLGVGVLYLNPVFASPSNHKYDTSDYLGIDRDLGTQADFERLERATESRGIKLVLDGVFNHTSSDSRYFDLYCRWAADGSTSAPGEACASGNDASGACESEGSPQRGWYFFSPGGGGPDTCFPKPPGYAYESWFGYGSLPKLNVSQAGVRALVWADGPNSAAPRWTSAGADGWRLDVAGDVDPGLANDPANDFWEGFRAAVRDAGVTGKTDTLVLGEEWGDATAWLLGNEWDSVMNYRFRSALLGWLFSGCSGSGCTGGTEFQDNDSAPDSAQGAIRRLLPSQLDARLRSIAEDYPPPALRSAMNLAGSHDTNRILFLLRKINSDSAAAAKRRLVEGWTFAFAYPGSPTIYYGDEVGLAQDGVYASGKWEDDPYNRAPFPWDDEAGGAFVADTALQSSLRELAGIRLAVRTLQDGDVQHGRIVNDVLRVYGFARTGPGGTALVALNSDMAAHMATFTGLNAAPYALPDGAALEDARSGATYVVSGGAVSVNVPFQSGVILVDPARVDTPAPPGGRDLQASGPDRVVLWAPVTRDTGGGQELATRYEVHRGTMPGFTPGPGTKVADVVPPPFGTPGGKLRFVDPGAASTAFHYVVRAFSALRRSSDSGSFAPEACNGADDDGDGTVDDAPAAPGAVGASLRVTRAGAGVRLAWQAAPGAARYAVYRAATPEAVASAPNRLGETAALQWDDAPPAGRVFHYLVTARDDCGSETME